MEIFGLEFVTLVIHWFPIQLLSVLLIFCAKKKQERLLIHPSPSQTKTGLATTAGESQKTNSVPVTPGKSVTPTKPGEDDDDDVKFNINIKKPEEKKDEFDDDEENPLAKIAIKPRNKNGPAKKQTAGGGTGAGGGGGGKAAQKMKTKEEVGPERAFLAPNEKQIGVSCYQFEPTQQQLAPAPPAPPKKVPMQKSGDGGTRTANQVTRTTTLAPITTTTTVTVTPAPNIPVVDTANTKSTLSVPTNKKTKTVEQERTHNDIMLEKTQKCDGENGKGGENK